MSSTEVRYAFHVEWLDSQADVLRRYLLTFHSRDNTVEMYDMKNRRSFLKRSEYPEIQLKNLYIGSVITIFSRQLKIIEYADAFTAKELGQLKGRTLALIKPDAYNHMGRILSAVHNAGFIIAQLKMIRMTPERAAKFCQLLPEDEVSPEMEAHLQADVVVAMELVGDEACTRWFDLIGPSSPSLARRLRPTSLRALYGTDDVNNAVHGSVDLPSATREINFFFNQVWPTTAVFNNCTLCIVRPHAFKAGGEIVSDILEEGFEISAMQLWHLDRSAAEEFQEVYKGIMPEFHDMSDQLCAGPCLVMEVRQDGAVDSFRKLAGPHDPDLAKHLRPKTLRAKYGIDRVKNAVHATDLTEDGLPEVEYFFQILYSQG